MKNVIIIPARYKSSRFPGKPLAKILGKEMILRVIETCNRVIDKSRIFVATDNNNIKKIVEKNNFNVVMTSSNCLTGTDRVAEANNKIKSRIVINVQGDEPLIKPTDIKKIILAKSKFPYHVVCGFTNISNEEDEANINLPKVVLNQKSELVYMSRSPVPGKKNNKKKINYYKQVCVYAFNKQQLSKFKKFGKKSNLEKIEDIEILRFFELGIPIKMINLSESSVAVDVKTDIKKVEKYLQNEKKKLSYF
tara:strand:+ start:647 stop:1396 length:750 start_codon:yes stop_codon:yes gene_type:complete